MNSVGILHGYLLDGSGSNLWTQSIVRSFCRAGVNVHLMCQEPHPERFDFIAEAIRYDDAGRPVSIFSRDVPFAGRCILHKPGLSRVLPVYVPDRYEEYDVVVPMLNLDDATIEDYIERNVKVLERIVTEQGPSALLANHAVLMSVVAQRVCRHRDLPFAVLPHGSAIEYAVKKDERFHRMAAEAFTAAARLFVIGDSMRQRVSSLFGEPPGIAEKMTDIKLGVDTGLFEPAEPASRDARIEELKNDLRGAQRGKTFELSSAMRERLGRDSSHDALRDVLAAAADYVNKRPDADCETKLDSVGWEQERILVFVGRLIAAKGVQAIVAALPSILQHEPRARLIVVGHGPLREVLEAMLHAMECGNRELLADLVATGRSVEGTGDDRPLLHVERYLSRLEQSGGLDDYFDTARELRISEHVVFTGYLVHRELRHLLPCCDVAIFPSIVAEAGPLVFLEAMASGVLPIGVDRDGIAASIDALSTRLPPAVIESMKLSDEPERLVSDIATRTLEALGIGRAHARDLRDAAVQQYDWTTVGNSLLEDLLRLR
jgi:glycosyltransferase involved in cell wall biosynthesis